MQTTSSIDQAFHHHRQNSLVYKQPNVRLFQWSQYCIGSPRVYVRIRVWTAMGLLRIRTDADSEIRYFGCIWIHQMIRCYVWLNKKWISKSKGLVKGYSRCNYTLYESTDGPFLKFPKFLEYLYRKYAKNWQNA